MVVGGEEHQQGEAADGARAGVGQGQPAQGEGVGALTQGNLGLGSARGVSMVGECWAGSWCQCLVLEMKLEDLEYAELEGTHRDHGVLVHSKVQSHLFEEPAKSREKNSAMGLDLCLILPGQASFSFEA